MSADLDATANPKLPLDKAARCKSRWLRRLLLALMIGSPIPAALTVLNQDVQLVPLERIDSRCSVCSRKATRTLERAAVALHNTGFYKFERRDNAGLMPVWCSLHAPDKRSENAISAYIGGISAFALFAFAYKMCSDRDL